MNRDKARARECERVRAIAQDLSAIKIRDLELSTGLRSDQGAYTTWPSVQVCKRRPDPHHDILLLSLSAPPCAPLRPSHLT